MQKSQSPELQYSCTKLNLAISVLAIALQGEITWLSDGVFDSFKIQRKLKNCLCPNLVICLL